MGTALVQAPVINPRYTSYKLSIRTSKIHRFGVYALENIPAKRKVIEYTGERVNRMEAKRRGSGEHTYLFTLDKYWTLDGAVGGSGAEIINHSCDPNCVTEKWNVGSELRMGIFAAKKILKGEEVTYNYQFQSFGEIKERCMCGSKNCAGNFDGVALEGQPVTSTA